MGMECSNTPITLDWEGKKMKWNRFIALLATAFLTVTVLSAQDTANTQDDTESRETVADESEAKWHNPDYRPYNKAFDDLIKLSDAYAKNQLRLALSNFQAGRSIVVKMREDVQRFREEAAEAKHMDEKWYWQTVDRKAREERYIRRVKHDAKLKAVTYLTRAINQMDQIAKKSVRESEEFKDLMSAVYRDWIVNQYDIGNIPQTIEILERYLALDPNYEKEVSPHKYLTNAYAFREKELQNYGGARDQESLFYRKKKNEHLLRATELKYQKGSPEYEHIMEIVNRDEVIAISPP